MTRPYDVAYVLYPRGVKTGGPEAMHQLVDSMRRAGQEAYLVARPGTETNDRVEAYARYDAPEAPSVIDSARHAVVAPEDEPMMLAPYKKADRFCWWLSIDSSSRFRVDRRIVNGTILGSPPIATRARRRGAVLWHAARRRVSGETALLASVHHLAQSEYAWSYLYAHLGVLASKLSDYTDLDGVTGGSAVSSREPSIAFNPTKSRELMALVQQRYADVRYVPLEGFDRRGLLGALGESMVYLDLGHHPGKDRMPREAAVSGSIAVVARRGAGGFVQDVPIPPEHKVNPDGDFVGNAIEAVDGILREPERHWALQAEYRRAIAREREVFDAEVDRIFVRGQLGSDV